MITQSVGIEEQEAAILAEIERLKHVESMQLHPGWAIVLEHFETVKRVIVDRLLVEKDQNEIVRLQERYKAFSEMLQAVSSLSQVKESYEQDLIELTNEKRVRDGYGLN